MFRPGRRYEGDGVVGVAESGGLKVAGAQPWRHPRHVAISPFPRSSPCRSMQATTDQFGHDCKVSPCCYRRLPICDKTACLKCVGLLVDDSGNGTIRNRRAGRDQRKHELSVGLRPSANIPEPLLHALCSMSIPHTPYLYSRHPGAVSKNTIQFAVDSILKSQYSSRVSLSARANSARARQSQPRVSHARGVLLRSV